MTTLEPVRLILDEPTLTEKQARFAVAIMRAEASGLCVTLTELAEQFVCCKQNVKNYVIALQKKGVVTWNPGEKRTLRMARPLVWREV